MGVVEHHVGIGAEQGVILVLVIQPGEQIHDEVEPRLFFVVGAHDGPGRGGRVRAGEHGVAGGAVVFPVLLRGGVDRTHLPLLERIGEPILEALFLFGLVDVEVVLEQLNTRAHQHLLERRHRLHEFLVLRLGAKAHHPLHPGAVVPTAVEQHEFGGRRQIRHIALEVPLRLISGGGFVQRHHAGIARREVLDDALNGAILARAVAPFEQDENAVALGNEVLLELHQLDLQGFEGFAITVIGVGCRFVLRAVFCHFSLLNPGRIAAADQQANVPAAHRCRRG